MKKKEKKLALLAFLLLFLIGMGGCASMNQILVDGVPMPNTTYISKNSQTNMRVESYIAAMVWKKDSKKDNPYLYPIKYLDINREKTYELPLNIAYVGGKIRIVNPLRKEFTVVVIYTIHYSNQNWPFKISHIVYEGNSHDKIFIVGRKIESSHPTVICRILVKEGLLKEKKSNNDTEELRNLFDIKLGYHIQKKKEVMPMRAG